MKKFLIVLLLALPIFAGSLHLEEGFVAAHTEMLMDSTIDPLNTGLKAEVSIDEGIESLKGSFSIEMNLFSSDNEDRDEHMHEATNALNFPLATFTIAEILKEEGENNYLIKGDLNFFKERKELTFRSEILQDDSSVTISATSKILVSDYGMEMPCMMFMCVRDEVDLFVKAKFKK